MAYDFIKPWTLACIFIQRQFWIPSFMVL